jgi:hypothetical protein
VFTSWNNFIDGMQKTPGITKWVAYYKCYVLCDEFNIFFLYPR